MMKCDGLAQLYSGSKKNVVSLNQYMLVFIAGNSAGLVNGVKYYFRSLNGLAKNRSNEK